MMLHKEIKRVRREGRDEVNKAIRMSGAGTSTERELPSLSDDDDEERGAAAAHRSKLVWLLDGKTNGVDQVVDCPFVSNDLVQLRDLGPIDMMVDGKPVAIPVHEKDDKSEPDDLVLAQWASGYSDTEAEIKQFRWDLLGTDFTIVVYGKRRTGKSHFISALLYQLRPYFPAVIAFTRTKFNGDLVKILPDTLVVPDFDQSLIEILLEKQARRIEEIKKKPPPHENIRLLLIFDDVLSAQGAYRYSKVMERLFFEGRHLGVSIICTSQDSKGLPPDLKSNTDLWILFPMQAKRDRETIGENAMPFLKNDKDVKQFFEDIYQFKHQFIAIVNCKGARPLHEQIYTGIITPPDLIPRYILGCYQCWNRDLKQLAKLEFDYLRHRVKLEDWNIMPFMFLKPPPPKRDDGMMKDPRETHENPPDLKLIHPRAPPHF